MKKRDRGQTPTNTSLVADFDWNQSQAFSIDNIKLLDRNHGILNLRLSYIEYMIDICQFGSKQSGIEGNMIKVKKEKTKIEKLDKSIQRGIDDAWKFQCFEADPPPEAQQQSHDSTSTARAIAGRGSSDEDKNIMIWITKI